jgi:hypothetical protein
VGEISAGVLDNNPLFYFTTPLFDTILNDVKSPATTYLSINSVSNLTFTNTVASTPFGNAETVEEIRVNAPQIIRSQYRLVTKDDYKSFITRNFKGFVHDVNIVNNSDYINGQYAYLKNIGLNNSLEDYENIKDSKRLLSGLINYNKLVYFGAFLIIFLSLFTIYCFWFQGFEKTVLLIIIYLIFSYILEQIFIYQHKKYFPKLDTIHFNILLKIYRYRFKNKTEFLQLDNRLIGVFNKYYKKV